MEYNGLWERGMGRVKTTNNGWIDCEKCGRDIKNTDPKFRMEGGSIVCVTCCYKIKGDVKPEYEMVDTMIEVDYPLIRYYLTKSGAILEEVSYDSTRGEMNIWFLLPYIKEMADKLGMDITYMTMGPNMKMGLNLIKDE